MKTPHPPKISKKMNPRRAILPLLAVASVWSVQNASAILTWDLRAVSVTPGMGDVSGPKTVNLFPGAVGADVTFELWAVVTGVGPDGTNETLSSFLGSIVSAPGTVTNRDGGVAGNTQLPPSPNDVLGNLSNLLVAPWKTASTTKDGPILDLDGDGDMDVGGNINNNTSNYIVANAGGIQTGAGLDPANFHQLTNGREFKISIATFHVTQILGNNGVALNWVAPGFTTTLNENARALFQEDGVTRNGADANVAVAPPVFVMVPEPTAFGMLILGTMGLVGFRRLGIRKNN